MPGTTMPPSTRATRSRFSSPAVNSTPNGSAPEQAQSTSQNGDKRQASLNGWLEPQVQQKPSFQEAGLMRHGVVENMAPLGTLPKVGVFKKAAPLPPTPETAPKAPTLIRKIVLKKRPEQSTPLKPAPVPVTPVAQTEDDTEEQEESENDESDSGDDDDEQPTPVAPPPRRRSTTTQDADEEFRPIKAASLAGTAKSANTRRSVSRATPGRPGSIAQSSPSIQQTSASSVSGSFEKRKEATDRVVEHAVDEALKHCRYPTAWALRTLYDENSGNSEFLSMFEDVFTQTADNDTVDRFSRLLHQKKKEGKKDNSACYYFVPPTTSSRPTPPRKAKPAPYGNLIKLPRFKLSHAPIQPQYRELQWHLENPAPKDTAAQEQQSRKQGKEQEEAVAPSPSPAPPIQARAPVVEETVATPPKKKQRTTLPGSVKSTKMATPSKGRKSSAAATPKSNGKAKLTDSPSMRRQTRASSTCSSSSSLSSARSMTPPGDDEIGNENSIHDDDESVFDEVAPSRASPAAPAPTVRKGRNANASNVAQPITRRKLPNAAKKTKDVSHSSSSSTPTPSPQNPNNKSQKTTTTAKSSSTTTPQPQNSSAAAGAAFSMPAAVDSPLFGSLSTLPKTKNVSQKSSAATRQQKAKEDKDKTVFPSKFGAPPDDEKVRLRLKAKNVTEGVSLSQSFIRYETHPQQKVVNDLLPGHNGAGGLDGAASSTRVSRSSVATPTLNVDGNVSRSTRSGRKRSHDEIDDQVSPTTSHFPSGALDVPSTATTSRAGTPVLRPAKKARTGLRVKNSPMKKKAGTSAGIPRASGERTSPAPNGFFAAQDDNDDYCASCGGNGELLCCDGCTRAFHLTCVDPPLVNDRMPAEWFCNTCLSSRDPTWATNRTGAFGLLTVRLEARNSSAFRLPVELREYFEGVQTGADGEYEEVVVVPKPTRKRKAEEEQVPDFFRLRDNDGKAVLCHNCNQAAADDRVIVPCSVCGLFWHIDCVDPPLTAPPVVRTWRCPAHVDDLLAKVPGSLGPAHKFRKIKGVPDIEPAFRRGNINNGYIEVIDDLDESEDESGLKDFTSFGQKYRLPAKGIQLDFIAKLREIRVKDVKKSPKKSPKKDGKVRKNRKGKCIAAISATSQHVNVGALEELQAARNLAQLSGQIGGNVETLVDTLIAEANPDVISLIARGNPQHIETGTNLNNMDEQSLRAMQIHLEKVTNMIKQRLGQTAHDASPASPISTQADQLPVTTNTNNANSHAPDVAPTTTTSAEDSGKELPSPPATDQPDDKLVKTESAENGMVLD